MAEGSKYKINVGDEIPAFTIKDHEGFEINEDDVVGSPLVLYFYPKDMTPTCTKEACEFRDAMRQMDKFDALVLGISPDNAETHSEFITKNKLNYTLLCDDTLEVAKKFDVIRDDNKFERTTFVIDSDGFIQWIERPVNVEGHLDRVLKAVKEHSDIDQEFQEIMEENAELEKKIQESLQKGSAAEGEKPKESS